MTHVGRSARLMGLGLLLLASEGTVAARASQSRPRASA
jgi:hypothetical protein